MEERVNVIGHWLCFWKLVTKWSGVKLNESSNAHARMQLAPTIAQKHEIANKTWLQYFTKLVGRIEISLSSIRSAKSIWID